jgi:hypothetical protein
MFLIVSICSCGSAGAIFLLKKNQVPVLAEKKDIKPSGPLIALACME